MSYLNQLQAELIPWQAHNFPGRPPWHPVLGVGEEAGELMHSYLKEVQDIRGTAAEHQAKGRDAIGDIIVYLADYCNARGWNLEEIVREVWPKVRERDWAAERVARAAKALWDRT